ncbi:predicted protein [Botrytis cinerea T4]|uniref:Uncharacterized protein n=1 Tax=Botryotinia fuckeliana (strain T4) TaxID=999810 RepID=G2YSJ8_BOTF4|nr:predicted protein [Botrytis cinerea T4]
MSDLYLNSPSSDPSRQSHIGLESTRITQTWYTHAEGFSSEAGIFTLLHGVPAHPTHNTKIASRFKSLQAMVEVTSARKFSMLKRC